MTAAEFQQQLGAALSDALDGRYRFTKSRSELRAECPDGHNVVVLAGSAKYSPHVSVDFYFGRNFAKARQVEKLLGGQPFLYHIQQFSPNRAHMNPLAFSGTHSWSVDINSPPQTLVLEVAAAIRGMAEPFFERFADMRVARDAIAANDRWCFGGRTFWRQLLLLDMALDDLAHFEGWRPALAATEQLEASESIQAFKKAKAGAN